MGGTSADVLLIVKGEPIAKGRPRFSRAGHTYTPARTRAHENLIRQAYIDAGGCMLTGGIEAEFEFIFETPKSWSIKKRMEYLGRPKLSRPDADNLIKCCTDALNGLAYTDDSQIWKTTCTKIYGAESMTIIRLKEAVAAI